MVEGEEYGVTSPSGSQGGELLATALQEAFTESKQSPVSWVFFSSLPLTCLFLDRQHASCHRSLVFYLWPVAGTQNSTLKGLARWGPIPHRPPCQENLTVLRPVPEKQSHGARTEGRAYCDAQ